ncbi:hypothetical protein L1987_05658 [Smallanthus sonchifolius]|uniref:Uncharacterized protein n=1 Tax=Smallanthus sonchifolius TaxID=185202 RepID=A0ACB9JW85_9ASTR|nr:hypothetical protein L1987_05658 [Smallanthus sonchifolius]
MTVAVVNDGCDGGGYSKGRQEKLTTTLFMVVQRARWMQEKLTTTMVIDGCDGECDGGDRAQRAVDLVGGFLMAFTTAMLSWNVLEFGGLMKGELGNAKEAIRWATDYLLKAAAQPDVIYPLMDNLEAQTYETFEKGSVKYIQINDLLKRDLGKIVAAASRDCKQKQKLHKRQNEKQSWKLLLKREGKGNLRGNQPAKLYKNNG